MNDIGSTVIVVITDANVLINLCHIQQVGLLGLLAGFEFHIPPEVRREVTGEGQVAQVEAAVAAGHLHVTTVDSLEALELYADLRNVMGEGEAACLALAATTGARVASDEKKRFKRKAIELLGVERILRTEDLLLNAIKLEVISIAQADGFKAVLHEHNYVMPFGSFSELLEV